ncbi:MAG: hypothetical protein K2N45_01375 [Helicobacter japonicus]|nr:hypothetical protein [Helicobacter japonicus]
MKTYLSRLIYIQHIEENTMDLQNTQIEQDFIIINITDDIDTDSFDYLAQELEETGNE